MAHVIAKTNVERDDLYCVHCKTKIRLSEKYFIEKVEELDEIILRTMHIDCLEETEEDEFEDDDNVNDEGY